DGTCKAQKPRAVPHNEHRPRVTGAIPFNRCSLLPSAILAESPAVNDNHGRKGSGAVRSVSIPAISRPSAPGTTPTSPLPQAGVCQPRRISKQRLELQAKTHAELPGHGAVARGTACYATRALD